MSQLIFSKLAKLYVLRSARNNRVVVWINVLRSVRNNRVVIYFRTRKQPTMLRPQSPANGTKQRLGAAVTTLTAATFKAEIMLGSSDWEWVRACGGAYQACNNSGLALVYIRVVVPQIGLCFDIDLDFHSRICNPCREWPPSTICKRFVDTSTRRGQKYCNGLYGYLSPGQTQQNGVVIQDIIKAPKSQRINTGFYQYECNDWCSKGDNNLFDGRHKCRFKSGLCNACDACSEWTPTSITPAQPVFFLFFCREMHDLIFQFFTLNRAFSPQFWSTRLQKTLWLYTSVWILFRLVLGFIQYSPSSTYNFVLILCNTSPHTHAHAHAHTLHYRQAATII